MSKNMTIMDGNEAAAHIAYRVTEISAIYPITPSTTMGELADQWASENVPNVWNTVPQVIEMQSEGGAAGTLHGILQAGALATTYTASQGLLLMIPNMYKIAGELTPLVIHVTARSLAAQALSIFGDHSDVMSVRATGFAMLSSGSVQEAHDFALIAHAATLEARVPFLHFFEGFRVSHELNKIDVLANEQIRAMIDDELVAAHRQRALSPEHPVIRGTAQNPDVYFQGRETVNPFYAKISEIVEKQMEKFAKISGRKYHLMEYMGDPEADRVIIILGSGAKAVAETVECLKGAGEKVGVLQIHLYRPFCTKHFIDALPKSVRCLAVLDRTKEPGSLGEPLYQDVLTALAEANNMGMTSFNAGMPKVIGGRYGLSSKEFTPAMGKAIFDEMNKAQPKNHFTIGINDDVSHSSLSYDRSCIAESDKVVRAIFYGLGSDGTVGANKNTIKIIGEETDFYAQGYFVYDSKKAGSRTISHLRFGPQPIHSPYLIQTANFIGCHQFNFLDALDVLENAAFGATFLLNSPYSKDEIWQHLPRSVQQSIIDKKIKFYVIDAYKVARLTGMGSRINTIMQTCFFAISGVLPSDEAIAKIKETIVKTYKRKGEEVIKKNFAAVEQTLANLQQVEVPTAISDGAHELPPIVSSKAPQFIQKVLAPMMAGQGETLPVSAMPVDGTYPTGTTQWEKRNVSQFVSHWNPDLCIQCGQCSMICPHSVIRVKNCDQAALANAPECFKTAKSRSKGASESERFRLQTYIEDCTGCDLCHVVCPATDKTNKSIKAIMLAEKEPILEQERKNIEFFESLPYADRKTIDSAALRNVQYLQPLFEFSGACAGCGETPYIRLVSQLFGDRMLVANATGCSSIYGGNLPTTPWCFNKDGRGPAWANSLFEDNAEFGLGLRLAVDKLQQAALELLPPFKEVLGEDLIKAIADGVHSNEEAIIAAQRERLLQLKSKLQNNPDTRAKQLLQIAEYLVTRSVWAIGGDGWAYDIGYGGLDHVLSCGRKVNILVLDTEVYSNTGGQSSKSTPRAALAKFAASGKNIARKDLGVMAMTYGNVYIAQISIGANPNQALRAIKEAESFEGTSLILAYSTCVAHGYEMKKGVEQQKLAVASGFWPLYRYNPQRRGQGLNPLQIDSAEPSIEVRQYAYNEPRFKSLVSSNPEHAELLMKQLQEDVKARWQSLAKMAQVEKETNG